MTLNLKENIYNFLCCEYISAIEKASAAAINNGFKIYLIGGIVRDIILKNTIKDIDITVEGSAVEFAKILEKDFNCKILSIQDNLKTAKVLFDGKTEIDFASTREEKYSSKGALPFAYNFGCELKKDVKRRDFTINTLALNLFNKSELFNLIDYYNGLTDIKDKKIRVLHADSFYDDPSRIIRALKFKMRLNFDYDSFTSKLMDDYLNNITPDIPLERIKNELNQYFDINRNDLYEEIISTHAYKLVSNIPVFNFNYKNSEILLTKNILNINEIKDLYLPLLLFKGNYLNEKLNLTSIEKKIISELKELYSNYPLDYNDNFKIYTSLKDKNKISVCAYYILTLDNAVLKFYNDLFDINVLISGKDLIDIGIQPSPLFSKILEEILKEKLSGNLKTKEEEINFVKAGFIG